MQHIQDWEKHSHMIYVSLFTVLLLELFLYLLCRIKVTLKQPEAFLCRKDLKGLSWPSYASRFVRVLLYFYITYQEKDEF